MRPTAFILSFYVLFLALLPYTGFADLFYESICCMEACESNEAEHAREESDGCSDLCNPFLSCSCSIGFTTIQVDLASEIDTGDFDTHLIQMEKCYLNQFIFQVWNPPKV